MTPAPRLVGVQPWFPAPLARWRWLTDPVPAERVAALRVAAAVTLLLDIGLGCLPRFAMLFTADGLAGREANEWRFHEGTHWSALRSLPDSWGPWVLMTVCLAAGGALLVGYRPLVSGLLCWACAVSFANINPWACNGGDQMRSALLLGVALSGSGAVWGVQSVRRGGPPGPVSVPGWPVKVLMVQLMCIYFFSGLYKLRIPEWRSGDALDFVSHNPAWSLVPSLTAGLPAMAYRVMAWGTIAWELAFPALLAWRRSRAATLCVGVVFHAVTFFTLEVGHFALYSLAWYAVFVPWERLRREG